MPSPRSKIPTGEKNAAALDSARTTAEYLRRLSGTSREAQAVKCGFTESRYNWLESGRAVHVTADEERSLETAFGVEADLLLTKPTEENRAKALGGLV